MKQKQLLESLVEFNYGLFDIRVWRAEKKIKENYSWMDLWKLLTKNNASTLVKVAAVLSHAPRVNAVQIRHRDLTGKAVSSIVIYNDWP